MRDEYVADPNLRKIARKYGVHEETVRNYCRDDKWREYAARIHERTADLSIEKIAKANVKHIQLLDGYLELQAKALNREKRNKKHPLSILGVDKAVRCKQLLLGNPDSRPAAGGDPVAAAKRALSELTTDELRELRANKTD